MSEKARRRKSLLFFISLLIFGYTAVRVVQRTPRVNEYAVQAMDTQQSQQVIDVEEYTYYDLESMEKVQPSLVVRESEVLGTSTCSTPSLTYSSKKICSRDATFNMNFEKEDESLNVGQVISRNADIRLEIIKVPPLLQGTYEMDTSVRQIQVSEDPKKTALTARPAGEMIEDKIVKNSMAPGDTQTQIIIEKALEVVRKPFGVKYILSDKQTSQDNTVSVDGYMDNNCGADCFNEPNPTPGKSNAFASVLAKSDNPPGHYQRVIEQTVDPIEDCDASDIYVTMNVANSKNVACLPSRTNFVASFTKRIRDQVEAIGCSLTGDADDKCVDSSSIVIIMESPWGTTQDCEDEACLNNYNAVRNSTYTPPSKGSKSGVYILTDCWANVSSSLVNPVRLSCAWDMDYLAQELEYQSHDNLPGESYPSKMDYIQLQVGHGETRTDPVKDM